MTIKFTNNDNISDYDVNEVIEGVILESKGKQVFTFDTNYNMLHFFNYFLEILEEKESYNSAALIQTYLENYIKNLPKNFNEVSKKCLELVEYDEEVKLIFSNTTKEWICAFLYSNFSELIMDEFFFFYQKSQLTKNLSKELGTSDINQMIFEIIQNVSAKIKQIVGNIPFKDADFKFKKKDLKNIENSPKNLDEAIDWLITTAEENIKHQLVFTGKESIDVLSSSIHNELSYILFYQWYLHHKNSPLRIWFRENKDMNDPYYITYYIIRNFVNYLILKNSNK
jgi:hypothetical protein